MRGVQLRLHLRCPRCRYDLGMRLLHHCDGCAEAWQRWRAQTNARLGLRAEDWAGGGLSHARRGVRRSARPSPYPGASDGAASRRARMAARCAREWKPIVALPSAGRRRGRKGGFYDEEDESARTTRRPTTPSSKTAPRRQAKPCQRKTPKPGTTPPPRE